MDAKIQYIDDIPKKYNKETLSTLVIEREFSPKDIVEFFGKNDKDEPLYPLERVYNDLFRWGITMPFIPGLDILEIIKQNIAEVNETISTFGNKSRAAQRGLKEYASIFEGIKTEIKNIAENEGGEAGAHIMGIVSNLKFSITPQDIVKIQQEDEKTRLAYIKVKQEDIKTWLKAVQVIQEAYEVDATLAAAYEELVKIDNQQGTQYSVSFLDNVKARVLKKISDEELLQKIKVLNLGSVESIKRKKKVHPNQSKYQDMIRNLADQYNVHQQVMVHAYRRFKDKGGGTAGISLTECIAEVLPKCLKQYTYLDENGRKKEKK